MSNVRRKYFDSYNVEDSFIDDVELSITDDLEAIRNKLITKYSYKTQRYISGNQLELEIYPVFERPYMMPEGIVIKKETTAKQKTLNNKNSRKRLERKLHANFVEGDHWITLTFHEDNKPKDIKGLKKETTNYIDRVNYRRYKLGFPKAKYIYVVEEVNGKGKEHYHIHLIMDSHGGEVPEKIMHDAWYKGRGKQREKIGYSTVKPLQYAGDRRDFTKLSKYITKDPEKYKNQQFRLRGMKLWACSIGLEEPKKTSSDSAFGKRKVEKMAVMDQATLKREMEAKYQNYEFVESVLKTNKYNGLLYVHIRMQKRLIRRI